jgi:FkbM family methyltransferase
VRYAGPKDAVRARLRAQLNRRRSTVTLHGVRVPLDGPWLTDGIRWAFVHEQYEHDVLGILERHLRADDRVLEAGAGLGVVTTAAAKVVGPEAVLSFEANPRLLPAIEQTGRANGLRLPVRHAVLGDAEGMTRFHVHPAFEASSLTPAAGAEAIEVPVVSFDDALAEHEPTFLIVDIEGGEVGLFGNRTLPAAVRALCLELHPDVVGRTAVRELLGHLMAQGFDPDLGEVEDWTLCLTRGTP